MQAALTAWQHVLGPDHPEFVALDRQYQQWIQQHPEMVSQAMLSN